MAEDKHIYINEDWSFLHDGYCWHLNIWGDSKPDKDGNTKRKVKDTTYHSNIERLSKYVLDMECGGQDSFKSILHSLSISSKIVSKSLNIILEDRKQGKKVG